MSKQKGEHFIRQVIINSVFDSLHVRRTDKISEASYQPLEKYMKHVEEYYLSLDLASPDGPPTPRKVFLATEDPAVVTEAKNK